MRQESKEKIINSMICSAIEASVILGLSPVTVLFLAIEELKKRGKINNNDLLFISKTNTTD